MRLALFPGSFDPFTCGHLDILERALRIFENVEVTVAVNANKVPIFSVDERCALIKASTRHLDRVAVAPFEGLIAEYARKRGAAALIRACVKPMILNMNSPWRWRTGIYIQN